MSVSISLADPIQVIFIFGPILVVLLISLIIIRKQRLINSLRASVKFDIKKFAKANPPASDESDLVSTVLGMAYIPMLLYMFAPALQLTVSTFVTVTLVSFLALGLGLLIQHVAIADSYTSKTNLLGILRSILGWDLVFLGRRFVRAITMPADKLEEVKKKSIEYSNSDPKLKKETQEFWKSPNVYPVLLQKYPQSMRDAVIIVTDIPWKEAVTEEPRKISAGIKSIDIAVGAAMLSYTPAVEMMSSAEHKKELDIDKVEVPIFTSMFSSLSADAQKNISAAALDSMRASDERVRRENAESRANILQERVNALRKDKHIDKRQDENERMKKTIEPEPAGRMQIVKKYGYKLGFFVLLSLLSVAVALNFLR